MPSLSIQPNRAYPNIPSVDDSIESHTFALQAIKDALQTHERRDNNYLKSFIRFEELVDLGIIDVTGEFILDLSGSGGGGGGGNLGDLDDVTTTNVANDDVIQFNIITSEWESGQLVLPSHTHPWSQITGAPPFLLNITGEKLGDLSNVSIEAFPQAFEFLVYNEPTETWINLTATELGISDNIGGEALDGDMLYYDLNDGLYYPTQGSLKWDVDAQFLQLANAVGINWLDPIDASIELLILSSGTTTALSSEWGTDPAADWTLVGIVATTAALESTGILSVTTTGLDVVSISDDGLRVLVGNNSDDKMWSMTLDSPYDFENSTSNGATASILNPHHTAQWVNDGLSWIVQRASNNDLRQYPSASAYVVNGLETVTATVTNAAFGFTGSGEVNYYMSRDGTLLYGYGETGGNTGTLRLFDLSTPYDISSWILSSSTAIEGMANAPTANAIEWFAISPDGKTIAIIDPVGFLYFGQMTVANDPSTLAFSGTELDIRDFVDGEQGHFSADGNTFYVFTDDSGAPQVWSYTKNVQNDTSTTTFFVGDETYPTQLDGTQIQIQNDVGLNWFDVSDVINEFLVLASTGGGGVSEIQLLADMEGSDGSTSYTELSQNTASMTFNGGAELDTAQFNSIASSLLLDGVNSFGSFPNISAYDLGTQPWTIEGFVRFNTLPTVGTTSDPGYTICSIWGAGGDQFNFEIIRDTFGTRVKLTTNGGISEQGTISGGINLNQWYHWAISRDAGGDDNIRAYFNGIHETADFGSAPADMGSSTEPLRLGSKDGTDRFLDGWIDDVRFTVGTALYIGTGNLSIPSTPFEVPAGSSIDDGFKVGNILFETHILGTVTNIQSPETDIDGTLNVDGAVTHVSTLDQQGDVISDINMVGGVLNIFDIGGTDFARFEHDATDFLTTLTNTADWKITGITAFDVVNYRFDVDQTVGAGQDNFILTYDDASGEISLEVPAVLAFNDLSDVDLTGAADNDMLFRSGGDWIDTAGLLTWDGSNLVLGSGVDLTSDFHRTIAIASGGLEANNTLTGTGFERVLTTSDNAGGATIVAHYRFSTTTTEADPGNGTFRMDNATPASVTELFISSTTDQNNDFDNMLGFLSAGDQIYIQQDNDAANFILLTVTANVDNTGWYSVAGTIVASGTLFGSNSKCSILLLFGGTGGALEFNDLTDVDLTGAADNDLLYRSGGDWIDTAGLLAWDGSNLSATNIGGILEANLLDKTAVETVSEIWTFTHNDGPVFTGVSPKLLFQETDVAADQGNWIVHAANSSFRIQTATDATPLVAVQSPIIINRVGTTCNQIRLNTDELQVRNYTFDVDQIVGAGQDNFVLTYDNASGEISLEAAAGGGGGAFNDLSDVDLTGAADNDLLFRSGGNWIDSAGLLTWDGNILSIFDAGGLDRVDLSHDGTDFNIQGTNTAAINIQALSGEDSIVAVANGPVELYHNDILRFSTLASGVVSVHSNTNADNITRRIDFTHLDGTVRGSLGHSASAFIFQNDINSGQINIKGRTSGGSSVNIMVASPDAETTLYTTGGTKRLGLAASGVLRLNADDALDTSTCTLNFAGSTGGARGFIGYAGTEDLIISNQSTSGVVRIRAFDSGDVNRIGFSYDPDGEVSIRGVVDVKLRVGITGEIGLEAVADGKVALRYDNVIVMETIPGANGGLQIRNAITGGGNLERALTTSDVGIRATTTQLEDVTDDINTNAAKTSGYLVFNTTTFSPVWASGTSDNANWLDATGTTAHSPV